MAVIKHNSIGRTDVSSRSGSIHYDNAKYGSVVSVSGSAAVMAQFFATGSAKGSKAFIIASAGSTVITPTNGDDIVASKLNTKERYEIGVKRVSGSGHVYVLY